MPTSDANQKPRPGGGHSFHEYIFTIPAPIHNQLTPMSEITPPTDVTVIATNREANFMRIILSGNCENVTQAGKLAGYASPQSSLSAYNKYRDALNLPSAEEILRRTRDTRDEKVVALYDQGLSRRQIAQAVGGKENGIVRTAFRRRGIRLRRTEEKILEFACRVYQLQAQESSLTQKQIAERLHTGSPLEFARTYALVRNVIARRGIIAPKIPEIRLPSDPTYKTLEDKLYSRLTDYGITMLTETGVIASFDGFLDRTKLEPVQFMELMQAVVKHKNDQIFTLTFGTTKVYMIKNLTKFYSEDLISDEIRQGLETAFATFIQDVYEKQGATPPFRAKIISLYFLRRFQPQRVNSTQVLDAMI